MIFDVYCLEVLVNFKTVSEATKHINKPLIEIEVAESIGYVSSGLLCSLAANFAFSSLRHCIKYAVWANNEKYLD
jgi:hypothetical protein